MQRLLFIVVMVLCLARSVMAQVRHIQPVDDPAAQARLAGMLGLPVHGPYDETKLVQFIHDKDYGRRSAAAYLAASLPKTPAITQALWDLFAHAKVIDEVAPDIQESMIVVAVGSLAQIGETGWEDYVAAQLPKMTVRISQLQAARVLVSVGRAEGWPIVKGALTADQTPVVIWEGLYNIEYYDGLPNPDGGKPIDVVTELGQLASTAPEQSRAQIQATADRIAQSKLQQR